jgi:hypothetical protein
MTMMYSKEVQVTERRESATNTLINSGLLETGVQTEGEVCADSTPIRVPLPFTVFFRVSSCSTLLVCSLLKFSEFVHC